MATATVAPSASSVAQKTSHPFTCVTCAIAFRSSDLQRGHMRSDWHRYNLKRRVASLPPLSSEVFADKVLSAQASTKAAAEKASFEKHCQACEKTYFSENAFKNHLGSQRHRMKLASLQNGSGTDDASSIMSSTVSLDEPAGEDTDDLAATADLQDVIKGMRGADLSDDDSPPAKRPSRPHHSADGAAAPSLRSVGAETPSVADTADTITSTAMPLHRCMFCNYDSTTLDTNIGHMTRQHGLFIPEQEYLNDLEGLVSYLQSKVADNCECLFCHKLKSTVPGIQTHMRDKGHCMIAFTTEDEMLEVGQFYDFRRTYSDDEADDSEEDEDEAPRKANGAKLGAARPTDSDEEDDDWESDEDYESSEEDEGHVASKRTQRNPTAGAYIADGELYLPSGRMAGHRDFARYFRQNLRNYPSADERAEEQQKLLDRRAHGEEGEDTAGEQRSINRRNKQLVSRGNGGTGMIGISDEVKRKVVTREQKDIRRAQNKALRYEMKMQQKANNQTHFRDDNYGW